MASFCFGGGTAGELQGWQRELQTYPFLELRVGDQLAAGPALLPSLPFAALGACSDTDNCSVTLSLILFGRIRSNSSRAEAGTAY